MSSSLTNRLAMSLFLIYLLLYSGFMLINVFNTKLMETTPFAGVNLAIWYGFGLIFAAVILAFIYGVFSKAPASKKGSSGLDSDESRRGAK